MKLTKLRIKDFKNHADSVIEFAGLTTLIGKQGAGKTSILDAIVCALIGRTRLTDARGSGLKDHIRHGAKQFGLELSVQNGAGDPLLVSRSQNQTKQTLIVPWGEDLRGRQALLLQHLGLSGNSEAIECLLDPRLFADRDPEEQRAILLKLVKTAKIEVPKAVLDYGITELASIGIIEEHLESIKSGTVRDLNRDIKALTTNMPVEPEQEEIDRHDFLLNRKRDLEVKDRAWQTRIGGLRQKLEDARLATLQFEMAEGARASLAEKESQLASLDDKLTAWNQAESERLKQEVAHKEAELSAANEELQKLTSEAMRLQKSVKDREIEQARMEARNRAAQHDLEDIKALGDACPTCKRALKPADLKEITALAQREFDETKNTLEFIATGLRAERAQLEKVAADGKKLRAEHDSIQGHLRNLEDALKITARGTDPPSTGEGKQLWAERKEISGVVYDLRNKTMGVSAPQDSPESIKTEIEGATQESLNCATDLESVRAELGSMDTETRAQAAASKKRDLGVAKAQLEKATMAVEALEKLKADLLGSDESKRFAVELNAAWKQFYPGTEVVASTEGISVKEAGGESLASYLSSGQKVILDAAIRIAAAKTTGFNVMAMDDANKLPAEELGCLFKVLRESGVQVIWVQTTGSVPAQAPEGVAVYRLASPDVFGPASCDRI